MASTILPDYEDCYKLAVLNIEGIPLFTNDGALNVGDSIVLPATLSTSTATTTFVSFRFFTKNCWCSFAPPRFCVRSIIRAG